MNILADASLPGLENAFPQPFQLTCYHNENEIKDLLQQQDILLCRATLKVNQALLQGHTLKFVATASSGTDHLDHHYLKTENITVIDAKGCNAIAVADYVVSCLAYLDKKQLINGNKAGIIGLGEVGTKVQQRLKAAQFEVCTYDPLKAQREDTFHSCDLDALYHVDVLCIHAELHHNAPYPSAHLINKEFLQQLKPGCIIINASRGGIVDEGALLAANKPITYCTDVYASEPKINKLLIQQAMLCTPHIAGHSLEAKYNAVNTVSKKIYQLLELTMPNYAQPTRPPYYQGQEYSSWHDLALTIYNPIIESQLLKQALNLEATFIELRRKHQTRHDFYIYFPPSASYNAILMDESIIDKNI